MEVRDVMLMEKWFTVPIERQDAQAGVDAQVLRASRRGLHEECAGHQAAVVEDILQYLCADWLARSLQIASEASHNTPEYKNS